MIDSIIKNIITSLGSQVGLDKEKIAIAIYGMQTIVYTILGIIGIAIIASFFKVLGLALIAFIFAALLRNFSGGAHCTLPGKCFLLTILIFPVLGMLTKFMTPYLVDYIIPILICTALICSLIVYIWAPVDTENKRIKSFETKKRLKIRSLGIIFILEILLLLFFRKHEFLLIAAQLGFLWQSFMLLPLSKVIIQKYDRLFLLRKEV